MHPPFFSLYNFSFCFLPLDFDEHGRVPKISAVLEGLSFYIHLTRVQKQKKNCCGRCARDPFHKIHDDHLPSARANAITARDDYYKLDQEFNQAYVKYTRDEKSYQDYYDRVMENLELVEEARELGEGSMNTTKTLKEALLVTAACEPSSICCQKVEVGGYVMCFVIPDTTVLTTPSENDTSVMGPGGERGGWKGRWGLPKANKNPNRREQKTSAKVPSRHRGDPTLRRFQRFAIETPTARWRRSSQQAALKTLTSTTSRGPTR